MRPKLFKVEATFASMRQDSAAPVDGTTLMLPRSASGLRPSAPARYSGRSGYSVSLPGSGR